MNGQLRLVNAIAFLLLLLSILVVSKTDDSQSLRARGHKLATTVGEMEKGSSSLQTMMRSGPSPCGPGHKSSEAPSQDCPQGSGPRPEEGLLHFGRVHH
ncbi:hypothetical protein CRYUN_Cryun18bG0094500 [Craigia yunnanensis]